MNSEHVTSTFPRIVHRANPWHLGFRRRKTRQNWTEDDRVYYGRFIYIGLSIFLTSSYIGSVTFRRHQRHSSRPLHQFLRLRALPHHLLRILLFMVRLMDSPSRLTCSLNLLDRPLIHNSHTNSPIIRLVKQNVIIHCIPISLSPNSRMALVY